MTLVYSTLDLGSEGPSVELWQKILGIPISGRFDAETQCATIDWQESNHIEPPDGIVGPKTWARALEASTMSQFIPNQITPVNDDDVVHALSNAYASVVGKKPDKGKLGLMVGQVALETGGTGSGHLRSVHNYNLGNIRGEYNGSWTSFTAGEIEKGKEVIYQPGEHNKFRAYPSLDAGAVDYVRMLQSRPHWWDGLQTGTVDGFIKGLTTYPAYFTAGAQTYANVLRQRMALYQPLINKYGVALGFGAALLAGAGAALGFLGWRRYRAQ